MMKQFSSYWRDISGLIIAAVILLNLCAEAPVENVLSFYVSAW
jgi:hypothetical protein